MTFLKRGKIGIFFVLGLVFLCFQGFSFGKSPFFDSLEKIGFTEDTFRQKKEISRYDLARILNIIDCQDCFIPDDWTKQYYNFNYWNDFIQNPDNNFNDIKYLGANWNQHSFYYCVAYVGDQNRQYMRGYPVSSTICKGNFCGNNSTSKADFFQVVLNIIQPKLWEHYTPNWGNIYQWYRNLSKDSLSYIALSEESKEIYTSTPQRIGIHSKKEFQAYLSYCMYNLGECGFLPQGNLKQGAWPISEVNVLLNEGIITSRNLSGLLSPIGGAEVLDIFDVIFSQYSACEFNFDYDCDGVNNIGDNCVYDYNPSQMDFDGDGIGDVCDSTINGQDINPLGIVDDYNHIVLSKLTQAGQGEGNGFGGESDIDSLNFLVDDVQEGKFFISVDNIDQNIPSKVSVSVDTDQKIKTIHWQWGDNQITDSSNLKMSHIYENKGKYLITAIATTSQGMKLTASMEVYLGIPKNQQYSLEIKSIFSSTKTAFSALYSGNFDKAVWSFDDGTVKTVGISENIVHIFEKEGLHLVQLKGYEKGVLKAVASTTVKVVGKGNSSQGRGKSVSLKVVSNPLGTPSQFTTLLNGINQNEISMIRWIWENGVEEYDNNLYKEHRFPHSGQKTVQQVLTLVSGEKFITTITFYLDNPLINFFCASKVHWNYQNNGLNSSLSTLLCPQIEKISTNFDSNVTKVGNDVSHIYYSLGNKNVTTHFMVNACINLKNQGEVIIGKVRGNDDQVQGDKCYDLRKKGTLNKVYHCDMDKDGIPDICDDDIDGDGKQNLLGMILYENSDCSYHFDDIDETGKKSKNQNGIGNNLNIQIFLRNFGVCSLDNCTFDFNPLQEDLNNNGVGDVCEGSFDVSSLLQKMKNGEISQQNTVGQDNGSSSDGEKITTTQQGQTFVKDGDRDGDGIPDSQDQCPALPGPEKWNGCPFYGSFAKNTLGSNSSWSSTQDILLNNSPLTSLVSVLSSSSQNQRNPLCDDTDLGDSGCGNGVIDPGETCLTCPYDVGGPCILCGNGIAEEGETFENCPEDVPSPSLCGNGTLDPGEECDNGKGKNWTSDCRIDCKKFTSDQPLCGNGVIDPGEKCETCPVDLGVICLKKVRCGDGILTENEECDEGENNGKVGSNCTNECTIENSCGENGCPFSCGNGVRELLEECDAGEHNGEISYNCTKECKFMRCGNGKKDFGEVCDDGEKNGTTASTCTTRCQLSTCGNGKIDSGETCENCPQDIGACPSLCGNGALNLGEACDRSVEGMKDLCTKDCKLKTCGNGQKDLYETCNTCPEDLGGLCSECSNGEKDPGETCDTCPQDLGDICIGDCGDGKVDQTEDCDYGSGVNGTVGINCTNECKEKEHCGDSQVGKTENCRECAQDTKDCLPYCGDRKKDENEDCRNCPQDYGVCPRSCGNGKKEIGEACDHGAVNGYDGKCSFDCTLLTCGNGIKDDEEDCLNCPQDLGDVCINCPNGKKDSWEICGICPRDAGSCTENCGNGILDEGEQCDWSIEEMRESCSQECTYTKCGNGVLDPGERCDDGRKNGTSDSKCSNFCQLVSCKNGIVENREDCNSCPEDLGDKCQGRCGDGYKELTEACDHGSRNGFDGQCSFDCTIVGIPSEKCGNGVLDNGNGEQCDHGTLNGIDGKCDPYCQIVQLNPFCGDGILELGEDCDYGKFQNGLSGVNCTSTCTWKQKCPNGIIDKGENCENCPQDLGEKCKPEPCGNGKIDPGETCNFCPQDVGVCPFSCGNGAKELFEECDAGEHNGEIAYNCTKECKFMRCGNGKKEIGEVCDDGEKNGTTSSNCTTRCNLKTCGNGKIDSGETCENCPEDVGACPSLCGNGALNVGEVCDRSIEGMEESCTKDCKLITCGNDKKDVGETCLTCPQDLGDLCTKCPNGEKDVGETCENCPQDLGEICVGECGDGNKDQTEECDDGEKNGTLQSDCLKNCHKNVCGDGYVGKSETCLNCPQDLEKCPDPCGNGNPDYPQETCLNCPQDMGVCPSSCGNGIKEGGEQCDHGNQNGYDGKCSDLCISLETTCGDGVQEGDEICDNGRYNGVYTGEKSCTVACTRFDPSTPQCGDGKIQDWENCTTCPIEFGTACQGTCGNGILEANEMCDHGDQNGRDGKCTFECKVEVNPQKYCGNGIIDVDRGEECDYGSAENGANGVCSAMCKKVKKPECGNGVVEQGEECDFGTAKNGKDTINCTKECKEKTHCPNGKEDLTDNCIECPQDLGEKCKPEDPKCGDGVCSANEKCTDCPSDCGSCQGLCGNGKKEPNEPCDPEHLDYKDKGICTVDCVLLTCGDGEKQDWEECDLGDENGIFENEKSCTIACTYFDPEHPDCGDGKIEPGEDCSCPIDLGKKCDSVCGDHQQTAGEECDEGDMNGKGICSNACKIDVPIPGPVCGNGTCEEGEGCEECPMDCGWCILPNCNSCPCEYADYKNDITDTDKIYAILRNRGLKILYNQSEGVMLSDFGL